MTDEELAESRGADGHLELACTVADKVLDVAYLAVAAFLLAAPFDRWLQRYPLLAGNWSLRLAGLLLLVMAIHIGRVVSVVVLRRPRAGAPIQPEHADLRRLAVAVCQAKPAGRGVRLVLILGLYWLIWTTGALWWLAAAGGLLPGQRRAGPTGAGADPAAVLQDRKARRPGTGRSHRSFGRRARACRSKASIAWT